MRLSPHFTLAEFTASSTAKERNIPNVPMISSQLNLALLVSNVLEPLRQWYGKPIAIGSGYRCATLNKAVGGVSNSQHLTGEAADLCLPLLPNGKQDIETGKKWFDYIRDHLEHDQLIWEHNAKGSYWIHVSFRANGNRKQVINNLLKKGS